MAFCQNAFIGLVATIFLTATTASLSHAQTLPSDTVESETIPTVADIARLIEDQSLVLTNSASTAEQPNTVSEAVSQIVNILPLGDRAKFSSALENLEQLAIKNENPYDEGILKLFTHYSEYFNFNRVTDNYETIVHYLEEIPETEHWLVRFHAMRLLSVTHTHNRNNALALQIAESALNLIPNEISSEAIDTRISATGLIAYLQNLQLNKEIALVNTRRLIELKLAANQPVDGIELLNNLMYSHNAWRDNEVRLYLVQTLVRLEDKYGSTSPGLSYLHASGIYIDIGQYQKAKTAAEKALSQVKHETLKTAALMNLASAHAGLGETAQARSLLKSIPESANSSAKGLYTQALIALKEGRADDALTLMNKRYDDRVKRFLMDGSNNTIELLASLENSSERQAERESALKREAALIQTRLDQQQKISRLLMALSALALSMGVIAILFARHRDKLSKMLKIKTEEAESADRMKTEFLGLVSHELRTPLNGIIGLADIMASHSSDEQTRGRAEIILDSGNILFNLIESIIDMSRLDGGKMELVAQEMSVGSIARELAIKWNKEAVAKGLTFTYHIPKTVDTHVELDPVRVSQCIDTLLSNAVRFTEQGRVHLHLDAATDPQTGQVKFSVIVADTGQGISEDVQSKLFTPFLQADASMTRKHGGSGLRLAIARAMARMMDGDVTVISREGRGSEFTLTFSGPQAVPFEQQGFEVAPFAPTKINRGERRKKIREDASADRRTIRRPQTRLNPDIGAEEYVYSALDATSQSNPSKTDLALEEPLSKIDLVTDEDSVFELTDQDEIIIDDFDALNAFASKAPAPTAPPASSPTENTDSTKAIQPAPLRKQQPLPPALADIPEMKTVIASLKNSRILIVDDVASNQDVIELMLNAAHINCYAVDNGPDALKLLEDYDFDVVIMDIRMPGMNGVETIRRIRQSGQSWANTPVLALTADAAAENNIACIEAGANVFLTKPVITKDLLIALEYLKGEAAKDQNHSASSQPRMTIDLMDKEAS
ncbi:signal transduction histidine kinase [Litorimonas taeanensis]|uniref:histidine kinase n=1 Tax=Litorimonas taeanensis TaxID=568099 RepID=A0A420WD73_9PROT|nr:response regulator [Litorimonas taeanensis]RKQ68905.1 signal transduction histidine kinase [Litorimonas taeanensis]